MDCNLESLSDSCVNAGGHKVASAVATEPGIRLEVTGSLSNPSNQWLNLTKFDNSSRNIIRRLKMAKNYDDFEWLRN